MQQQSDHEFEPGFKVYFPRLIVPASTVTVSFLDFLIMAVFWSIMMVWYQYVPTWRVFMLPLFVLAAFGASVGVGLW